jgi:hypothetical protein
MTEIKYAPQPCDISTIALACADRDVLTIESVLASLRQWPVEVRDYVFELTKSTVQKLHARARDEGCARTALWLSPMITSFTKLDPSQLTADVATALSGLIARALSDEHIALAETLLVVLPPEYLTAHKIENAARLFHLACSDGALQVAKLVAANVDLRGEARNAVIHACGEGHLAMVHWLVSHFEITRYDVCGNDTYAFMRACENGHLATAQWLTSAFGLTMPDIGGWSCHLLEKACANNSREMAEWLVATFDYTPEDARDDDNRTLQTMCTYGHLALTKWFTGHFRLTARDVRARNNRALDLACLHGHLPTVQWLVSNFELTATDAHRALMFTCTGRPEIARWLIAYLRFTMDELCRDQDCELRRGSTTAPPGSDAGFDHGCGLGSVYAIGAQFRDGVCVLDAA